MNNIIHCPYYCKDAGQGEDDDEEEEDGQEQDNGQFVHDIETGKDIKLSRGEVTKARCGNKGR